MATNKKYSVLTYNINGYEVMHNIPCKSENAEYIYVTNDRTITSDDWTVVYIDAKSDDAFDTVFDIRYNPFNYVNTDIVVKIDGSMTITGDLDKVVDAFELGGYDCCVMAHPSRTTMIEEYLAWVNVRGYDYEQAQKCLGFIHYKEGYHMYDYKGLYQYNFMIQRKNKMNMDWNLMTYSFLKYLAPEGKQIDRLDQTIGSFVLNKYFNTSKVMVVLQEICDGTIFTWYAHNSNIPLKGCEQVCVPYLFNEQAQAHRFNINYPI